MSRCNLPYLLLSALLCLISLGRAQQPETADAQTTNLLDPSLRDKWVSINGDWKFDADSSLTGNGESEIVFRQAYKTPFRLTFDIEVLKGLRPRLFLGPYTLANEAYTTAFGFYPKNNPFKTYPYKRNTKYKVTINIDSNSSEVRINDELLDQRQTGLTSIPILRLSAGDAWSPGSVRFSNLQVVAAPDQGYLKNADLKEDWAYWHGDGEVAFLKKDGTEGSESDVDASRVIKMPLASTKPHLIFQKYKTLDHPKHLHVGVDVLISEDYKRSTLKSDYTIDWVGGFRNYYSSIVVPNYDFWIRNHSSDDPNYFYITQGKLKPDVWTTLDYSWDIDDDFEDREIDFCAPPGQGTIYLRNPTITQ